MAKKDRQKRSARKARAAERKELEEKRAASQPSTADSKKAQPVASKAVKKAPKEKGRLATWFAGVRSEMKRVTWPTREQLKNYAFGVIGMLIVFGVAIWLVDTGVVAVLVKFSGLRG